MEIRRIRADEGLRLRALRLHALADTPMAFASTFAREEVYPETIWHERAAVGAAGRNVVTIVAERDGGLVGMATGFLGDPKAQDESQPMMVGVFVDGTVRRQGVGVALVESVVAWLHARGSARIHVWIMSENEPAAALYRRCGFQPSGATRLSARTPALLELEMVRNLD
jgi:RimJ/RimL family protein N-acetyltransferase